MALWGSSNWKEMFEGPYAVNIKSALEFSNCRDYSLLIPKSYTWEGQPLNESSSQMVRGHLVNSQTVRVSIAGLFSVLKTRQSQWLIVFTKLRMTVMWMNEGCRHGENTTSKKRLPFYNLFDILKIRSGKMRWNRILVLKMKLKSPHTTKLPS